MFYLSINYSEMGNNMNDEIKTETKIEETITENIEEKTPEQKPNGFKVYFAKVTDFIEAIAFAVACAILIMTFFIRMGYVCGESMLYTMYPDDRYLLSNLFYTPKQGDIVVFAPDSTVKTEDPLWVKRVIATAGQWIDIKDGCVYVSDDADITEEDKLDEKYTRYPNSTQTQNPDITFPMKIPEGYVFLMGDNRTNSRDSRSIGCVDTRSIIGKVLFKLF